MSKATEAVDRARDDTRNLYKQIEESTSTQHAKIRDDLQRVAESLKTVARDQQTDQKQHLEHAAMLLEQAAANAKNVGSASAADIRTANMAMRERTRDALEDISHTVALNRAAAHKQQA